MKQKRKMEITILGSGTCVPSLERCPCSVLIRGKDFTILLDAGPGTIGQMLKLGININEVDYIVLSHFHLDHCADLAYFCFATKYPTLTREKPLTIVGGKGLTLWFEKLSQAFGNHLVLPESIFTLIDLDEKGTLHLEREGLVLDYTRVDHRPESRAYRFTDQLGFSMVYSGDTDSCGELAELAKNCSLMICESSMPDGLKVPGHLTPSLAGRLAQKAGALKLVLTHFYPECEGKDLLAQCRKTYSGPVVLARDLMAV